MIRMIKVIFPVACFLLSAVFMLGHSQSALIEVKGLPTREIFDLLIDKKGFLWVGHDMGISRYDGVNFTHFSHPSRSSLSITDLLEDEQGRIWCHNFTGQVFYIENEEMHWLSSYKNEEESNFPRMTLCDGELIVTSHRGLFVCDLKSLKGRYVVSKNSSRSGTRTLTVVQNKIVAFDGDCWYLYDKRSGLVQLLNENNQLFEMGARGFSLQPVSAKDTIFLICNPPGIVYQLVLKGNQLSCSKAIEVNNFINSVVSVGGKLWVNTNKKSFVLHDSKELSGYNISDMVIDKQGNRWIGSLKSGLFIEPKSSFWNVELLHPSLKNELVTSVKITNKYFIAGTANGSLSFIDQRNRNNVWKHQFTAGFGSVNLLSGVYNDKVLVSTSAATLVFDLNKKTFDTISLGNTKQVAFVDTNIVMATAGSLSLVPISFTRIHDYQPHLTLQEWCEKWKEKFFGELGAGSEVIYAPKRTRSVAFNHNTKELYVSFMDGVYVIDQYGIRPFIYQGSKVYSNSMQFAGHKLFIGTFNNGLLIKEGSKIRTVNTSNGLFSNAIVRLKAVGRYLWIFTDNAIQLLDMQNDRVVNDIELPPIGGSGVYDVDAVQDTAYLATHLGVYRVLLTSSDSYNHLKSYLTGVSVNNSNLDPNRPALLPYHQNHLQFSLSIPWYSPTQNIYFKYRLRGAGNDNRWYTTQGTERTIRFASLMPGDYVFESHAVVSGFQEKTPIVFRFSIAKPWWKELWFMVLVLMVLALAFYLLYYYRMRQLLKLEQMRRTISSDLHDEIGSTISSINIYSELAKADADNAEYLDLIQENTRDVISKLDDLVWSINPKNDSLEQLINRMQLFAEPLLAGAGIQAQFKVSADVYKLELPVHVKQNLYLIFKEVVNNVVKHAVAKECRITIGYQKALLTLMVEDNGIGFEDACRNKGRNGISNIYDRGQQIKAHIAYHSEKGKGTKVTVAVPLR